MSMLTDFLDKMPKVGNWVESTNISKPQNAGIVKRVLRNTNNLFWNLSPWIYTGACIIGGSYGLGAYIGLDLIKGFRDNLKKNKLISDPVLSWYDSLGYDVLTEEEYNKEKSKGKLSDENSLRVLFKSIYKDK